MNLRHFAVASGTAALLAAGIVISTQAQTPAPATTTAPPTTTAPAVTTTSTSTAPGGVDAISIQQNLEGVLDQPLNENEYHYDPQGRRDPFRSLIGSKEPRGGPQGVAGFLIEEIDLQGVVRTRQGLVGMVTGPDNNGYLLRVGDKVFDGEVVRITASSIIFRQETREIVKELTPEGERR